MSVMEFMGRDHDRLDRIFKNFQGIKSTDTKKAKEFFHAFKIGLQKHIVWEEEILFPIFEDIVNQINNRYTLFGSHIVHKKV